MAFLSNWLPVAKSATGMESELMQRIARDSGEEAQKRRLVPVPLDEAAFERFGSITRRLEPLDTNDGHGTREDYVLGFPHQAERAEFCLSYFRLEPRSVPVDIDVLERHPFSAQAFMPACDAKALIVVAETGPGGAVAEETLTAFISGPGEGFVYRPGTWHAALTSFGAPGKFFMTQWVGTQADCVTQKLSRPIRIELAKS